MKKLSNLKPETDKNYSKDNILYKDDFIKVIKYKDWSIVSEKDCVLCIPYLIETNQFIIRQEHVPTYMYVDGQEFHLSIVGGGIEKGESPEVAMLRELEEEAGIVLRNDFKIDFDKPLFVCKTFTNKYHMAIIPLNEGDYHEVVIKGDGSMNEKMSKTAKLDIKYINTLNTSDIITELMLQKFKKYLNL